MPTYVYECAKCGDEFELYQSFSYGIPLPEIDARGAELAVYLRPYETQLRLCEATRQLVHTPPRSADRASHTPVVSVHRAYSLPSPSQASGSTQRGRTPLVPGGAQSR